MKKLTNKDLAKELHKPIIWIFNKRKVRSPFIDNNWSADLADMQLISKFNKIFRFLLCVIDVYSKYAWVVSLKEKKYIAFNSSFQKISDKSNHKPSKIRVHNGSEFYNRSVKSWLEKNGIEMYSTYNEEKYVVGERFTRTWKKNIDKYMTSVSKNVHIDKLDDIVNKFDNTNHMAIKMKSVDVKSNTYINSSKEINYQHPKFKIDDMVRISKYKNIFAKGYIPNCSEEVFVIKKVKDTLPWRCITNYLRKKFLECFTKTNCKKQIKKNLELKK